MCRDSWSLIYLSSDCELAMPLRYLPGTGAGILHPHASLRCLRFSLVHVILAAPSLSSSLFSSVETSTTEKATFSYSLEHAQAESLKGGRSVCDLHLRDALPPHV